MARIKDEKKNIENIETVEIKKNVEEEVTNEMREDVPASDSNELLLQMLQDMRKELEELKALKNNVEEKEELIIESVTPLTTVESTSTEKALVGILQTMADNKSNKEITIVHAQEMAPGLSTTIVLSNLTIAFRHLGEQRVLTWQQFEEFVSKYPNFIKRGIVLLDEAHADLCEKYQMKCYAPKSEATLTPQLLTKLGSLSIADLEKTFLKLSSENQKVLMSYWLGKCYEQEKDKNFYDRYKIELLNRLSNSYAFGNVLADMNMDDVKKRREN